MKDTNLGRTHRVEHQLRQYDLTTVGIESVLELLTEECKSKAGFSHNL